MASPACYHAGLSALTPTLHLVLIGSVMMVMHSVPAVPAPWTGPLFTSDGTTWGEDLSRGERKTGLPSQDPLAAKLAGLGWAGFKVESLQRSSCQDSQAGSVGSVSQLLHPEGIPLCLCLWALLAEAGQPFVPRVPSQVQEGPSRVSTQKRKHEEKEFSHSIGLIIHRNV